MYANHVSDLTCRYVSSSRSTSFQHIQGLEKSKFHSFFLSNLVNKCNSQFGRIHMRKSRYLAMVSPIYANEDNMVWNYTEFCRKTSTWNSKVFFSLLCTSLMHFCNYKISTIYVWEKTDRVLSHIRFLASLCAYSLLKPFSSLDHNQTTVLCIKQHAFCF